MTASMTPIDLIINLGQDVLESVTNCLNSPLRRFQAVHCLYISVSFTSVIVSMFVSVADINNAPCTIVQMWRSLKVCFPA